MSTNDDGGPRRSARRQASIKNDNEGPRRSARNHTRRPIDNADIGRTRRTSLPLRNKQQPVMISMYVVILSNNILKGNPDQERQSLIQLKNLW